MRITRKRTLLLSVILMLSLASSVSAYVIFGGKLSASDAKGLKYWKDSSVSNFGYSTHIDHGAN